MKKLLLLSLSLLAFSAQSQKKKTPAKAAAKKNVMAKSGTMAAEWREGKSGNQIYFLNGKDTVALKSVSGKMPEIPATGCKVTPFNAKGTPLCLVSWQEKSTVGDAKSKLENITKTEYRIVDPAQKTVLHENAYTVNNITEIVWLDPNNTASKTIDKVRRDGFELTVDPQGDLVLANKTQQDKMAFDAATKKYAAVKSAPMAKQPTKKKK